MKIQRIRFEPFGGIIGTEAPVSLAWADRAYLRSRGFDGGEAWAGPEEGPLSAPVEMEIALTSRCNLRCSCCYMESSPGGADVPAERVARALRTASEMKLFHVAFGGGEPLLHPRLFELACLALELGLLPTLTTNGILVDGRWARRARRLFARVNVSVDLPGGPRDNRASLESSLAALQTLRRAGIDSGVNFIVTASTFSGLPELFAAASRARADSVLVLRPKPSGLGARIYGYMHPDPAQQEQLLPVLLELSRKYELPFHLDCAFAPLMLASGAVPQGVMQLLGAYGCIAGSLLATVDVDGLVHPCSHLTDAAGPVEELPRLWAEGAFFERFRRRHHTLKGKCASCSVKELCRGGCAVVNRHHRFDLTHPDPDLLCQSLAAGS